MASRNERRRKARQRAATTTQLVIERREAGHDDPDATPLSLTRAAARIEKAAQSRQPKTKTSDIWDPEKTVPPPIPPEQLWSVFETNAFHASCINAKVADAVGRGWQIEPKDKKTDDVADELDAVTVTLEDLLEDVCPKLTFRQLCEQAARELDAIGWGGWEVLRDQDGVVTSDITGILPVPSYSIRAVKDSDDVFCIRRGDKKVFFKRFGFEPHVNCENGDIEGTGKGDVPEDKRANELILFKHYTPRTPWYGIPPWVSAMPAVAEFGAIREFNVSFFESGGQADRHFHVAAKNESDAEELAQEIKKQVEESRGEAHTTVITHGDESTNVTVTALAPKAAGTSGSARESNFRGGKEDLKEEIRVAHQVPPGRLGIAEGGALAGNANDSMDDDYRIGVVEPLQEIMEAEIRRTLFGDYGFADKVTGWKWSFEDRTQDDTEDEHDRAMQGRDKGVLSPNDAREKVGEERVDDPAMDRYYIAGNPISTDPAVTDVAELLRELRDALSAAVSDGGKTDPKVDALDDNDPGEVEQTPEQVAASEFTTDSLEDGGAKQPQQGRKRRRKSVVRVWQIRK